jgi:hypothetical protein
VTAAATRDWPYRLRLLAFAAVLAFQAGGPFYRHVLHGTSPIFRNWVMYRGVGFGIVDARFAVRRAGGSEAALDRFAALGYAGPRDAPADVWRIEGRAGLRTVVRRLCERLEPGTDLRVRARLAAQRGWRPLARGERNLCARSAASRHARHAVPRPARGPTGPPSRRAPQG